MLSLRFKTSQQLDALVSTLEELEATIQQQQNSDDSDYIRTSGIYSDTINAQNTIIGDATTTISQDQGTLGDANNYLGQANTALQLLQQEAEGIQNFLASLAITRAQEHSDYESRVSDSNLLITGIQRTEALFQQEAVGNSDLDQNAVSQLISLLNQLEAALQASIADDTNAENTAENDYSDFVANRNARLAVIATDESELEEIINDLESDIAQLEVNIAAETTALNNAQALLSSTEQALSDLDTRYANNKAVRAQQISLLEQVQATLTQAPSDVENILNSQ